MSFFHRSGIVNVRMVITEEKILSNIDRVQKLINPNSKKQIVQLEDDSYFKDLIESIKTYLLEYPKKKNFPRSVYKASYDLVEYATNQFEENTKKIEELIRKREKNISLASELRDTLNIVKEREEGWQDSISEIEDEFGEDIVEALNIVGRGKSEDSENVQDALKLIEGRISNLEANLHIGIDMERIEDRSKALSFIGIEIAEALKYIPAPIDTFVEDIKEEPVTETVATVAPVVEEPKVKVKSKGIVSETIKPEKQVQFSSIAPIEEAEDKYFEETRFDVKPSLWERIKNSKIVRRIRYIMKIKVVLELPAALPDGRDNF